MSFDGTAGKYPGPDRLGHNTKQRLILTCHAGLDPASRNATPRKCAGFPFDLAQGGEPVEPRVKPGMTKTPVNVVLSIVTQSQRARLWFTPERGGAITS